MTWDINKDVDWLKEQVRMTLLSTKRQGMEKLVNYLENHSDYFEAPCSKGNHLACKHGLLQHHWNIYQNFIELNKLFKMGIPDASLAIVALLHDLCKVGLYEKTAHGYVTNEEVRVKGHGKLSVSRAKHFIALTPDEEDMILYHMGTWGCSDYYDGYDPKIMHEAIKNCRYVQMFAACDMGTTIMEDEIEAGTPVATPVEPKKERRMFSAIKLLEFLRTKNDSVPIEEAIDYFGIDNDSFEMVSKKLLSQGDIFSPKPGRLRILE